MAKRLSVMLVLACLCSEARAQVQSGPTAPPTPPIETIIAKSVGFIRVPYRSSDGSTGYIGGTCFFVAVPDNKLGQGNGFLYIVTNRHVATAEGVDPKLVLPEVDVEVNASQPQNGSSTTVLQVPLRGNERWFFPADESVDLAVLPRAPTNKSFDVQYVPTTAILTEADMSSQQIGVGDSVFFVGFFLQFPGVQRVEPIYRQGTIAMLPVDRIQMSDGPGGKVKTLEHLFLADAHAFHGNSGSPLFVQMSGFRNGRITMTTAPFRLIGIVNGFVPERSDTQVTGAATFESSNDPNSGILTFVPAQELLDLLNSPALRKLRDDSVPPRAKP